MLRNNTENSYSGKRIPYICKEKALAMWDYYYGNSNNYDLFAN